MFFALFFTVKYLFCTVKSFYCFSLYFNLFPKTLFLIHFNDIKHFCMRYSSWNNSVNISKD